MKKRLKLIQNIFITLLILFLVLIAVRFYPQPPLSTGLSYSTLYYDEHNNLLRMTLSKDDKYRLWTPIEEISPTLIEAFLLQEDQYFYWHFGFNPFSLSRAFFETYITKSNKQGASTITMQVARMKWNINTRTISGKLYQIAKAIELEARYSKKDILEAYLNLAPYGRNIEGVGAASLIYFNKRPSELNLPEALTLAVLPQSPSFRVDKKSHLANQNLLDARNRLFARWEQENEVDERITPLFQLPMVMRQPEQLPFEAPHFIDQIIAENLLTETKQSEYESHFIHTTLDLRLQHIIEQQISNYIELNKKRGVNNATALLIDSDTIEIKAMIGSANFSDPSIQGQVNGTNAQRSPGSTLKPFIYALGFDQSLIHPATVLKDVKTDFGFYTPENFDLNFRGPITVTDALIKSRNIPAVYVASKLKTPSFYQFLKEAHINNLATEEFYGLALVLGGGEVSSQELATLYAMLNNRGEIAPLRFIQNQNMSAQFEPKKLLSPESSFMTKDILLQNIRREDILYNKQTHQRDVFFKTGTSWGFRDAWTVGGFKHYILIVWLGNFDGSSNNAFVGVDTATPLFFNIINAINAYFPNQPYTPPLPPENLKKVEICLPSGKLLTKWCQAKGSTWFIPGVSPIEVDDIFRPVMIDNKTGEVACPPYDPLNSHIEVFEYWPSDLERVFTKAKIFKKPPPSQAKCKINQGFNNKPPKITSPLIKVTYQFRLINIKKEKITLSATSDGEVKKLFWFVDNHFIGSVEKNNDLEWVPSRSGRFKILVVDDLGASDSRWINVELID